MLPGLVDPFPNCYFLVCVFILPLMVIVFKLYLLKRNVVTFYPLTVVLIFYLCSLLGRDIALIMVQICRKESILLLLLLLLMYKYLVFTRHNFFGVLSHADRSAGSYLHHYVCFINWTCNYLLIIAIQWDLVATKLLSGHFDPYGRLPVLLIQLFERHYDLMNVKYC